VFAWSGFRVLRDGKATVLPRVRRVVLVKEKYIALAVRVPPFPRFRRRCSKTNLFPFVSQMLRLIELEKCVVEGGGAIGVAALLQNLVPELKVSRM
jgi:hypothetical protein